MKPNFALNLSHEGIVLLHRSPRGTWTEVGEIALDDPNLRENLSFLRSTAVGLEGKGFGSKLILPESQILYLEVEAPGLDDDTRREQILAALEGQTPYAVADLAVDWTGSGSKLRVAVVAKETLDEAEEFAVEHRFNPISFVGPTDEVENSWQPFFGRTDYSFAILADDADVRDMPSVGTRATSDENLFAEEGPKAQTEEPEPTESLFVEEQEIAADENLFAEGQEKLEAAAETDSDPTSEPEPELTPQKVEATSEEPDLTSATDQSEPSAVAAVPPAFSSRRPPASGAAPALTSGVKPDGEKDRPIDRVASRIAISADDGMTGATGEPAKSITDVVTDGKTDGVPKALEQDRLRASFLEDEAEHPKNKLVSLTARFGPMLAGLAARFSKKKTKNQELTPEVPATPLDADPAETQPTRISAVGGIARKGLGGAQRGLVKTGRKGAAIFKSLGVKAATRLARKKSAKDAPPVPPLETVQKPAAIGDAPLSTPFGDGVGSVSQSESRKRKVKIAAAAAVLVLLGMAGLAYTFLASDGTGIGSTDGADGASRTTLASSGVRADNRARPRPSDMAALVAARNAAEPDPLTAGLQPVRPQRRSVFEGQTDPDADLPDTATPVTALSEQELADIRAAGLPVPTQEEIAEGGDEILAQDMSPTEITAAYEATGILQSLLSPPRPYSNEVRDDIFVAALDRELQANDANILPNFENGVQDDPPAKRLSPLSPDMVFDLDARGFVKPTKDGALNPDGILVLRGKPATTPPEKPKTEQLVPPNPLLALKPKPRPGELKTGEDAIFVQGRLTLAQLRARKPKSRPQSEQASLTTDDASPTELAVLTSFQPAKRPSDFEKTVEKAKVRIASTAPATGPILETGPALPTRANVAKTATIKNAINLTKINLIGVYGTPSKRNALLRLPSGRFVKVKIGDRVDGGRVAAIGTNSLSYVKSGRSRVLKIPQ